MSRSATTFDAQSVAQFGERRIRLVCFGILPVAFVYVLISAALSRGAWTASLQHSGLILNSVCDVFVGGAAPGILITLLMGFARPNVFRRPVRQAMLAVSLFGAAAVAILPVAFVWLAQ